jgi:hypothetical protein
MSAYPLVDAAAKYCWGKGGQEVFKAYFDEHAPLFVDAPIKEQHGEQDLEFYALFQEYLKIYEETIGSYIESLGSSIEDFYYQLQTVQENSKDVKDKKLVHFVNYMIGCTDYPAFYKMMVRAAKKYNKALMADAKASARAGGAGGKDGGATMGVADVPQEPADSKDSNSRVEASPAKGASDDYDDRGAGAKADFK